MLSGTGPERVEFAFSIFDTKPFFAGVMDAFSYLGPRSIQPHRPATPLQWGAPSPIRPCYGRMGRTCMALVVVL